VLRLFVHRCSTGGYPDQGAQRYGPAGLGLKGETNAMPAHNSGARLPGRAQRRRGGAARGDKWEDVMRRGPKKYLALIVFRVESHKPWLGER